MLFLFLLQMNQPLWKCRAVIIHQNENGYGLTVSGDNPVSVQTIKKGKKLFDTYQKYYIYIKYRYTKRINDARIKKIK